MFIRPYPLAGANNSHLAAVNDNLNRANLSAGKGVKLNHNSHGVTISSANLSKNDAILYKGELNTTAEYFPYDMIFVNSTSTYIDPNTGNVLSLTPGTYVCTNYIPPASNNTTMFTAVVSAYGIQVSNDLANSYRWYQYNNYYPTTNTYNLQYATYGSYSIVASQSFWQVIGATIAPTGSVNTNFNYRGLYSATPPAPYMTYDVVQYQNGTDAGMWLSMINNNGTLPPSSIGWLNISSANGTWI